MEVILRMVLRGILLSAQKEWNRDSCIPYVYVCKFVTCNNLVMGLNFIPFMSAGIFIVKKFALA